MNLSPEVRESTMVSGEHHSVSQVLMNGDLLYIILDFATSPGNPFRPRAGDVVSCARVCRAFHGPSVDIIWRELAGGMGPLWDLLGPGIYAEFRDFHYSSEYTESWRALVVSASRASLLVQLS